MKKILLGVMVLLFGRVQAMEPAGVSGQSEREVAVRNVVKNHIKLSEGQHRKSSKDLRAMLDKQLEAHPEQERVQLRVSVCDDLVAQEVDRARLALAPDGEGLLFAMGNLYRVRGDKVTSCILEPRPQGHKEAVTALAICRCESPGIKRLVMGNHAGHVSYISVEDNRLSVAGNNHMVQEWGTVPGEIHALLCNEGTTKVAAIYLSKRGGDSRIMQTLAALSIMRSEKDTWSPFVSMPSDLPSGVKSIRFNAAGVLETTHNDGSQSVWEYPKRSYVGSRLKCISS